MLGYAPHHHALRIELVEDAQLYILKHTRLTWGWKVVRVFQRHCVLGPCAQAAKHEKNAQRLRQRASIQVE